VTQTTLVVTLSPPEQARLERELVAAAFEQRAVEHARFQARGEGVIATLYTSGKLVIQGKEVALFAQRFLGRSPEPVASAALEPDHAMIGSDEAGKGDYFGPLVVAAVKLGPGDRARLRRSGVMDSKKLSDDTVRRLASAIESRFAHSIEVLEPVAYNDMHERVRNLNPMLADLHARAIRRLVEPGIDVLVDQFGDAELLASRLADQPIRLRQAPRAEREMAAAAASVLARNAFLARLARLSDDYGVDLHKGAGEPTDRAARRFVAIHGAAKLREVSKLHFRNTRKIGGARG
jgi:ribonuclease HIII